MAYTGHFRASSFQSPTVSEGLGTPAARPPLRGMGRGSFRVQPLTAVQPRNGVSSAKVHMPRASLWARGVSRFCHRAGNSEPVSETDQQIPQPKAPVNRKGGPLGVPLSTLWGPPANPWEVPPEDQRVGRSMPWGGPPPPPGVVYRSLRGGPGDPSGWWGYPAGWGMGTLGGASPEPLAVGTP